jgi:acetyl-CoA carboxylase/biotin carboxylase 1
LGLGLVVAGGLLVLATQTSSPQELWAAFSATPATIRPQPAPQVYARQATSFARGVPMQQVEGSRMAPRGVTLIRSAPEQATFAERLQSQGPLVGLLSAPLLLLMGGLVWAWQKSARAIRPGDAGWSIPVPLEQPTSMAMAAVAMRPASDAAPSGAQTSAAKLAEYVQSRGGNLPIRKVLIANNGMAATKFIHSIRTWTYMELGDEKSIEIVAMASAEDLRANAKFLSLADHVVEVPAGSNKNNYANVDLIIDIAVQEGVDAVWPGWGHASENPKLSDGLKDKGIKFIGPTGPTMAALGDKIAANILAQTAEVPCIPWSGDGLSAPSGKEIPKEVFDAACVTTSEEALAAAQRIGYPVMIKASEGGGGKGIRMANSDEECKSFFDQVCNEVPGSPVFMMQLCSGARHIEVQIVGDQHGNALALNGRDCSTQRRFQKIFEEGPPTIVPPEMFKQMELSAKRLTQSIGYQGAGTVEYLYQPSTNSYYFLELNPRLQVEHPVTEQLTSVNVPATQLQVAMGIPLNHIPEIRRFYGLPDPYGTSPINFMEADYTPIDRHCIAARITAENPDEGFKPTSGTIREIKFRSTPKVWGYFSVGSNGGIHEFADSQFGHLFSTGTDREDARKHLIIALKEMEVRGEIRNPVDYLVQLLETEAFKENTIDTSWLDGLLKEKNEVNELTAHEIVIAAVIYRAFEHVKTAQNDLIEALQKGQLSMAGVRSMNNFPVELSFKGEKYAFMVSRTSEDTLCLNINGEDIYAKVRQQPDGSLLTSYGGALRFVSGMEEPLGLRVVVNGFTYSIPNVVDPSELRSDVSGRLIRFLQKDGAQVEAGRPYAEVESMKMVMTLSASETGSINHMLTPGSIISPGDQLAGLQLLDPSRAAKILPFTGKLDIQPGSSAVDAFRALHLVLDGFEAGEVEALVQSYASQADASEMAAQVGQLLQKYLDVEQHFVSRSMDDAVLEMVKANKENLEQVVALNMAHQQLRRRNTLVLSLLRQVGALKDTESLADVLGKLAALPGGAYGEVALAANQIIDASQQKPFEVQCSEVKEKMKEIEPGQVDILQWIAVGADFLSALLPDEDVARVALETYVRKVLYPHKILSLEVQQNDGLLSAQWQSQLQQVPADETPVRCGFMSVLNAYEPGCIAGALEGAMGQLKSQIEAQPATPIPIHDLHIGFATAPDSSEEAQQSLLAEIEGALQAQQGELKGMGVANVYVLVPRAPDQPAYYSFSSSEDYSESALSRNTRPGVAQLLELSRLQNNYNLQQFPSISRYARVYLGTEAEPQNPRRPSPQALFLRTVSYSNQITLEYAEKLLLSGLDELDRAMLDPRVLNTASSRMFLNLPTPLDLGTADTMEYFSEIMDSLLSRHASRLLKLRVDEIEVKVRIAQEDGSYHLLRMIASSMTGEWLRVDFWREYPDSITGETIQFCTLQDEEERMCSLEPYPTSSKMGNKRAAARRVGSTYAYDFLGLMNRELVEMWNAYAEEIAASGDGTAPDLPPKVFEAQTLGMKDGEMVPQEFGMVGTNSIGMLAWLCKLKTPEYPEGREIVIITNDVTIMNGSFGVREDEFFEQASTFARNRGLPRVYIACNSGARIGLIEDLKPKFKVAFKDAANPSAGYEYLYLSEEDYTALPENTVQGEFVFSPEGEKRFKLSDIIGQEHGIGVENLRGSGMIAGETSRAYQDAFTLNYVTGRTVGIGAYLVRLGQRVIQAESAPVILTGHSALNSVLGREVYTSMDQLGGPQIMHNNGVSHMTVNNDQEGMAAILEWLSFVPKDKWSAPPVLPTGDPIDREIEFMPTKAAYDPRHMMAGCVTPAGTWQSGFFDKGSFKETLSSWGKSVVVGRARLGGIPFGCIAVETRMVEQRIPADPANPDSRESILPQAGQVWYPDSAYKTATAINDFNRGENLPLMIFANWRGFSGGTRDMYGEILKFGAMIVDALVDYKHPVFVYIPPNGELRGGAWVVIDPTINSEVMEMYADVESRGGILEPAGIAAIKFRQPDQIAKMHQMDKPLQALDEELAATTDPDKIEVIKKEIRDREVMLMPLYLQIAHEFADLHDRSGRMKAKGVIRDVVEWKNARGYFYWRAKRRLAEEELGSKLQAVDPKMTHAEMTAFLQSNIPEYGDDKAFLNYVESNSAAVDELVQQVKQAGVRRVLNDLLSEVSVEELQENLAALSDAE